jgi:hypothetical protein
VNAQLKAWEDLPETTLLPYRAGYLTEAIHVLQARETTG